MKGFMNSRFTVTELLLACCVPQGKGAPVHKDRAAHGLVFYISGAERYHFEGGKTLEVRAEELLFLPKGSSYTVQAEPGGACYAINFDISEQLALSPFVFHPKSTSELQAAFFGAEQAWRGKQTGYTLRCCELLYRILYKMQSEYHSVYVTQSKVELIAPAVAYIHEHYTAGPLCVATLAGMCGITPEYFRAVFRKFHGTSPLKYINNLRLSHARELILSGLYTVSEAAELSGFSDAAHFSREFKKHFGVPPVVYKP